MAEMGRPSLFSDELVDKICSLIASSSMSLKTICDNEGMPNVLTIYRWLRENENFRKQYVRAKEDQADFMIEEMIEISDDSRNDFITVSKGDATYEIENKEWTTRSKLRVDTRKWIASKLKPKKYGDRVLQEISGIDGNPIATTNEHRVIFENYSGNVQIPQTGEKSPESP